MVTGRLGHVCAAAVCADSITAAAAKAQTRALNMMVNP
jgi:hypothetical protein